MDFETQYLSTINKNIVISMKIKSAYDKFLPS